MNPLFSNRPTSPCRVSPAKTAGLQLLTDCRLSPQKNLSDLRRSRFALNLFAASFYRAGPRQFHQKPGSFPACKPSDVLLR